MDVRFTPSQSQRFRELGGEDWDSYVFSSVTERDAFFRDRASALQRDQKAQIRKIAEAPTRNPVAQLENDLANALNQKGFIEVKTPLIISANSLTKMGIEDGHPLLDQVFWVGPKKCLRPMLAPNLYFLMRHLKRSVGLPLRLFEIGPCFQKESKGSNHLEEFTMLNLVELGPDVPAIERLKEHISTVMNAANLSYELAEVGSEVYGTTLDVEVDGVELASGAVGPLPMDEAHGIVDPWAGVGFGLERMAMLQKKERNIRSVGRSLVYINGARIDI